MASTTGADGRTTEALTAVVVVAFRTSHHLLILEIELRRWATDTDFVLTSTDVVGTRIQVLHDVSKQKRHTNTPEKKKKQQLGTKVTEDEDVECKCDSQERRNRTVEC